MKKNLAYVIPTLVAGLCTLHSCSNVDDTTPDYAPTQPEAEYFDFNTSEELTLNINYGKYAANALISVYASNPLKSSADGFISQEADFRIFANEDGAFVGKASLPSYTDSVWVSADAFGAPYLIAAKVVNGTVNIDCAASDESGARSTRATRAATDVYSCKTIDSSKKLYSIVDFVGVDGVARNNQHGAINYNYNSGIFYTGKIDANTLKGLKSTLWGNVQTKPTGLDNSRLVVDTKHINTSIAKAYEDEKGNVQTVENAQVYLTLLHERASYRNVLGYYYYKSDEVPASADGVEKFVIVPNVSFQNDGPYTGYNSGAPMLPYASSQANKRIQLLYRDPATGTMTTKFPAGYTIGYFIIADGWWVQDGNRRPYGHINTASRFIYSNNEWNAGSAKNFISLSVKDNGAVVYGVEDGGDKSYEDVLFTIDANPSLAIQDPDRPEIEPEKEITITETTYKTYAFEDIWPNGGDYDLNDVIVAHKRSVAFSSKNNLVSSITDEFTMGGTASYTNAFAVVYDRAKAAYASITADGMEYEKETQSVIVTKNVIANKGKTFKVVRTFNALNKADLSSEDLNPYVISQYVQGARNRTEIHLPKHSATSMADNAKSLTGDDAWYIDKQGRFPFSISLPTKSYTPAPEGTRIDRFYKGYATWVLSKGEKQADWYLEHSQE